MRRALPLRSDFPGTLSCTVTNALALKGRQWQRKMSGRPEAARQAHAASENPDKWTTRLRRAAAEPRPSAAVAQPITVESWDACPSATLPWM